MGCGAGDEGCILPVVPIRSKRLSVAEQAAFKATSSEKCMRVLSPVVWSEGMHLAQHHFQAQGRYFEELTEYALSSLFFQPYGLVRCELDGEALLNGTVSLTHARGI